MSDFVFWETLRGNTQKEITRVMGEIGRGVLIPDGSNLEKEYYSRIGYLKGLNSVIEMGQYVVTDMLSTQKNLQETERGYDA